MNQIKVLDKSIYNRIAAGEVVERPLSIVKELVENSIDAGATAISIDIKEGGMKRISVSDNGKGVLTCELKKGFGLSAMTESAERFGGNVQFDSEVQDGFELIAVLPLV